MIDALGVPKETAELYEKGIREGGILLAVTSRDNQEDESHDILRSHRADQIRTISVSR